MCSAPKVNVSMKTRVVSLVFLLVMAGGTFASVPIRFSDDQCAMSSMLDMDCCKAALLQKEAVDIGDTGLLCALSCAQNGTTVPPNVVRVPPPSPLRTPSHPAIKPPLFSFSFPVGSIDRLHGPPGSSAPTYLRNLALLI